MHLLGGNSLSASILIRTLMLTYSARPRELCVEPINAEIEFPCKVNLVFTFEPGRTFGGEGSPSKTVPLGAKRDLAWISVEAKRRLTLTHSLNP